MKVLFDCIVTQTPAKCSTTIQFVTLAEHLLKQPDVFIYWPIPDRLTDEEVAWYPQHDRIKYTRIYAVKDRMKEYNRLFPELDDLLRFNGTAWDWDVLVTVRSTQVPMMRVISTSPLQHDRDWTKRIYLIEAMMVSSHKPNVATSNEAVQDRLTIEAYLAADAVYVGAFHQRPWVMEMARTHFSAARAREASAKMHEVSQVKLTAHAPQLKQAPYKYDGSRKFGLAFVGRLAPGDVAVYKEVMESQFILHGAGVRPFICTITEGEARTIWEEGIQEILRPGRQEFWRICKEEMDLVVCFMADMELNMSRIEPMIYGVPSVFNKAPWSLGTVGDHYPLFAKSVTEAYAWVNAFRKDYSAAYEPWERWWKEWFIPTYTHREEKQGMYTRMTADMLTPLPLEDQRKKLTTMGTNQVVLDLIKFGGDDFKILDVMAKHRSAFGWLGAKLTDHDREKRSLTFSTAWNEYRVALKAFHGYEDASTTLGHLKKVKE